MTGRGMLRGRPGQGEANGPAVKGGVQKYYVSIACMCVCMYVCMYARMVGIQWRAGRLSEVETRARLVMLKKKKGTIWSARG